MLTQAHSQESLCLGLIQGNPSSFCFLSFAKGQGTSEIQFEGMFYKKNRVNTRYGYFLSEMLHKYCFVMIERVTRLGWK